MIPNFFYSGHININIFVVSPIGRSKAKYWQLRPIDFYYYKNYRERISHARGVYPTQDNSRMRTARLKQKEESDTRIIAKKIRNLE